MVHIQRPELPQNAGSPWFPNRQANDISRCFFGSHGYSWIRPGWLWVTVEYLNHLATWPTSGPSSQLLFAHHIPWIWGKAFPCNCLVSYGSFHKWSYPIMHSLFHAKPIYKWMIFRSTPIYGIQNGWFTRQNPILNWWFGGTPMT